jgi:hypothetical protein
MEDPVIDAIRRSALSVLLHTMQDLPELSEPRMVLPLPDLDRIKIEAVRNLKENNYCFSKTLCTKLGTA